MEEKVKLVLLEPEIEQIRYQGNKIDVKPYLSKPEMDELQKQYIEKYFVDPDDAEYFLLISLLDICTNIRLFDEGDNAAISIDEILSHWDLIQQIRTKVLNYGDFYARLQSNVRHLDLGRNSLKDALLIGYAKLDDLINSLPERLSALKITDEDVARVKEIVNSPILKEMSPLLNEGTEKNKLGYAKNPSPTPKKRTSKKSK